MNDTNASLERFVTNIRIPEMPSLCFGWCDQKEAYTNTRAAESIANNIPGGYFVG